MFNIKRLDVGNTTIGRFRKKRTKTITNNNITNLKNVVTYDKDNDTLMINNETYINGLTAIHPVIFTLYAHDFSFSEDNVYDVVHYDSNINVYKILPNKICSFFQTILKQNYYFEANILVRSKNFSENNLFTFRIIIPSSNKDYIKEQTIELTPKLEYTNSFSILPFSFNLKDSIQLKRIIVDARFELVATKSFELHSATCLQFNESNMNLNKNNVYGSLLSKIDILRNTVRNIESIINCTFP